MPQALPRLRGTLHRFSLRQRILLIFAGMAAGAVTALALALYFGYQRNPSPWSLDAVIVGGIIAGLAIVLMILGVWRLFDEHVAKPIERLSGELRARTHSHIGAELHDLDARHLGDLPEAATSLMRHLYEARNELAETIAREVAQETLEKDRLITLLSYLPTGVLVCTGDHRLVLYNGEALRLLGDESGAQVVPCLDQPVFGYLDETTLRAAYQQLLASRGPDAEIQFVRDGGRELRGTMRLVKEQLKGSEGHDPAYIVVFDEARSEVTAPRSDADHSAGAQSGIPESVQRPPSHTVVYDFGLLTRDRHADIAHTPLDALTYVVFDTETTGLLPNSGDKIVQLAAVRIVNGRRVEAEVLDTLVNPGRNIPPSSTRIHGITEAMVADAPDIRQVAERFHAFAKGAVLVAHNAGFDLAFLRLEEPRTGLRFDHPVLDTAVLSAVVFGDGENHGLDALANRLGVSLTAEARHTALGDAMATADALLRLIPALQARGLLTFGALEEEIQRHGRLLRDSNAW